MKAPGIGPPATIGARDLFRRIDWSNTTIGAIETWPRRLRMLVEMIWSNRYPMIVLWGADVIAVAYNDAYAALIGNRHPRSMGESNQTTWPEVWHINGPIYAAVMNDGRDFYFEDALYALERNDWAEEVYLTISYSPARDDDERIGGVLITMVETTRSVLNERRLSSLRELASRTAGVRTIAGIGSIAAKVITENADDVVFAIVFGTGVGADLAQPPRVGRPPLQILGAVGLEEADALDLEATVFAVTAERGNALIELGTRRNGEAYPCGSTGAPARDAYVAALAPSAGGGPLGWVVLGLSPALPRDARYLEYLELVTGQLASACENALAFSREHRIAETLQRAALPGTLQHFAGLTVDAVYEAGSDEAQIGGDWYDAFALGDGRVVFSIGDVSGSGVVAAAAMGAARQMIRALAQTLDNPIEILNAVDRAFRIDHPELIMTAFVGFLGADRRRLTFASAGHPPPLARYPDGVIEALWAPDLPIGLRTGATATASQVELLEGSVVVLYTDGLTEATRDPIEGEARLRAALATDAFAESPRKAAFLYDRVLEGTATDDVALLVIELRSTQG